MVSFVGELRGLLGVGVRIGVGLGIGCRGIGGDTYRIGIIGIVSLRGRYRYDG